MKILKRGCGYPKAGKIYMYIPAGEEGKFAGKPTLAFALCPTWSLPDSFGLAQQGMQLRQRMVGPGQVAINAEGKEIYDMWDWIGEGQYPNPMDWFMEITKLGFHQLVQRTLSFDLLTPESVYYGVHARASINFWRIFDNLPDTLMPCPQQHELHDDPTPYFIDNTKDTCFRLLEMDLVGTSDAPGEKTTRVMPSFSYDGWSSVIEQKPECYQPAAFVKLPIGRLVQFLVYKDSQQNVHQQALHELEKLEAKLKRVKVVEL